VDHLDDRRRCVEQSSAAGADNRLRAAQPRHRRPVLSNLVARRRALQREETPADAGEG
jgi:hypothetical protein